MTNEEKRRYLNNIGHENMNFHVIVCEYCDKRYKMEYVIGCECGKAQVCKCGADLYHYNIVARY